MAYQGHTGYGVPADCGRCLVLEKINDKLKVENKRLRELLIEMLQSYSLPESTQALIQEAFKGGE